VEWKEEHMKCWKNGLLIGELEMLNSSQFSYNNPSLFSKLNADFKVDFAGKIHY
jgi:hypothetical protein